MHAWRRVRKHFTPSFSSIVRLANKLWFPPNFPRLCWLSAILQTCQLSHFWRDCPTFWACKSKKKKRDSLTFLKFQWWQISLNEQQRMMSILHRIFTSVFSLVHCDRFSYEKLSLSGFFLFLVMYMHTVLAQCPTFLLWYVGRYTIILFQTCGNKYFICILIS